MCLVCQLDFGFASPPSPRRLVVAAHGLVVVRCRGCVGDRDPSRLVAASVAANEQPLWANIRGVWPRTTPRAPTAKAIPIVGAMRRRAPPDQRPCLANLESREVRVSDGQDPGLNDSRCTCPLLALTALFHVAQPPAGSASLLTVLPFPAMRDLARVVRGRLDPDALA